MTAIMKGVRVVEVSEHAFLPAAGALLSDWGYLVQRARTASEALAAFETVTGRVDLIFADYHLVRDDGISVIGKLRKRARRHIPAVLITADRTPAVADLALAHDIHVLRKPVKPAALRAAIAHVIIRAEAAE